MMFYMFPLPCLFQEPRWKSVRRVSPVAPWRWRRSWASRATPRSKLLSPGLAPMYNLPSNRDMTTLTVSKHTRTNTHIPATLQSTLCYLPNSVPSSGSHAEWFLTDASTCMRTALRGDSQSVSTRLSTCLSKSQPSASSSPITRFPRLQRDVHAPRRTTHILRSCLLRASCSSVCEHMCVCL